MKRTTIFLMLFVCFAAVVYAADSATVLARILAGKRVISAADLASVEAAESSQRVEILAAILERKGILTAPEMAQLTVSEQPPARLQLIAAATPAPMAAPAPQGGPEKSSPPPTPPVTAQSKFPVTIYGTLLLNSFYNTAATNIEDIPLFANKQGSDALGNDKNFGMTARQTRFGMRYQGPMIGGARLSGQLELDLLGGKAAFGNGVNMDLPRLRIALGRLDWSHVSFIAGQDWSIFAPLNPTSFAEYAIPEMSASGNAWIRMPQLRAEFHNAADARTRVLLQLAAIDPDMGDYNTAVFSSGRTPGIGERGRAPGVESRLALTSKVADRDFTIGVSTHYAHGKNAGTAGPRTLQYPLDSWGVAADYTLPFGSRFNLSGELYEGRALGIFSVASGEAILAVGGPGQGGVLSRGGWSQAQFNFTPKWQTNIAYGIDQPRSSDLPVGNRVRNQTYMANLMYKYTAHITLAWEWRRFLTAFKAQRAADEAGDHINMALVYVF